MEDPQLNWSDPTDVLQGIMAGQDGPYSHPDLTDCRQSGLRLDPSPHPLLDLDLGSIEPRHQPAFLGWPPSSSSTEPHDFYHSYYPASRLTADQDAWNPLQVTGVPNPSPMSHMSMAVGDREGGFARHHYRTPSESGSQYMGSFHSGDSGYGGTSCTTHSVVTSSYGVDSMSSPQIGPKEQGFGESLAMFDQAFVRPPLFARELVDSPVESVKCEHPACTWVGKCPSDKRKHEARHRKLFKCDEPNCPRKEGFGTINDLARHKKCVHNKEPERGPKMMYLCFGKNCPRPSKKWPRLDNFKQHLSRMHPEEDADTLLKKSMDWYENLTGQPGEIPEDTASQDDPLNETQQDLVSNHEMDLDSVGSVDTHEENIDISPSGAATPKPPQYHDPQPEIPTLSSLVSLASDGSNSTTERGNTKSDTFVADAADNLIHAMTKMMNNRGRRSSQHSDEGIEIEPDNTTLTQPQRQMLQKVLSAALERLSDDSSSIPPEPSDDKQDWFQCDVCSKRTRLRCEMKKHQKRHERPYGCTFPHCAKSFGSKADWKRHESSQHLHLPSWLCTFHDSAKGASCERIFYRGETYTQHLSQHHRVPKTKVKSAVQASRLDLAEQSHFWCGFCSRNVSLRNSGAAALDERFNHIDVEHFKKGEKGRDWCFPTATAEGVGGKTLASAGAGVVSKSETVQGPERSNRKRKFSG